MTLAHFLTWLPYSSKRPFLKKIIISILKKLGCYKFSNFTLNLNSLVIQHLLKFKPVTAPREITAAELEAKLFSCLIKTFSALKASWFLWEDTLKNISGKSETLITLFKLRRVVGQSPEYESHSFLVAAMFGKDLGTES